MALTGNQQLYSDLTSVTYMPKKRNPAPERNSGSKSVFLNVPYDASFSHLLLAYICGITAHGLTPRATLELQDGTRRLDRIIDLIRSSRYAIHDLSRVEIDPSPPPTPRFNMPFKLGLSVLHASNCPGEHIWFLFEALPWRIQKSLSDLNGTDAFIHDGTVEGIFRELAQVFVHTDSKPTVQQMQSLYDDLALNLPRILTEAASKNPFNARAFRDIVFYLSALSQNLQ